MPNPKEEKLQTHIKVQDVVGNVLAEGNLDDFEAGKITIESPEPLLQSLRYQKPEIYRHLIGLIKSLLK